MRRYLFNFMGLAMVTLGVIGLFLPVFPTTPFLIAAAWSFSRGNPRYAKWLREHAVFGPIIINWEQHRCVAASVKYLAMSMMLLGLGVAWLTLANSWVKLCCVIIVCLGCIVMLKIPNCADCELKKRH